MTDLPEKCEHKLTVTIQDTTQCYDCGEFIDENANREAEEDEMSFKLWLLNFFKIPQSVDDYYPREILNKDAERWLCPKCDFEIGYWLKKDAFNLGHTDGIKTGLKMGIEIVKECLYLNEEKNNLGIGVLDTKLLVYRNQITKAIQHKLDEMEG